MSTTKRELSDALLLIGEQMHSQDASIAQLRVAIAALKATLAMRMNPSDPKQALEQIENLEAEIAKRDPSAPARQTISDALELVRMIEKHGHPKES